VISPKELILCMEEQGFIEWTGNPILDMNLGVYYAVRVIEIVEEDFRKEENQNGALG
jgi:hypothetical protein